MDKQTPDEILRSAGGTVVRLRKSYPIPLTWFADVEPAVESRDFVQGLLLEKSLAVVYGESNSGKTFWASDLALSVASGVRWNGRRVEQGAAIYCCLEGGYSFRNRIVAWRDAHKLGEKDTPFAAITTAIDLLDPKADVEKLIETIRAVGRDIALPVKLVVIDTLSRALAGGNENAPDDMGGLVRNTDRIREEAGACVLFVHHSGKDQARGARGHSLLRAAADTEIEVMNAEGERTASVTKQRDLPALETFSFRLRPMEVGRNRYDEAVTTCVVEHGECGSSARRPQRLSKNEVKAKLYLADLIAREGNPLPAGSGFPTGVCGVPETRWRDECETRRLSAADARKNRNTTFRRSYQALLDAGIVAARDELVWLTHPAPAGQARA